MLAAYHSGHFAVHLLVVYASECDVFSVVYALELQMRSRIDLSLCNLVRRYS